MTTDIFDLAVAKVKESEKAFCRFITANDVNLTSHQCGFYVPKEAQSLLFDFPGEKGSNKEKFVKIRWQDSFETDSRFIYYGTGTRNEYRITRFGHGFPFLEEKYVGSLLILCKNDDSDYSGVVLSNDEDIDSFFSVFNLSHDNTNYLINKNVIASPDDQLDGLLMQAGERYDDFPPAMEMSNVARSLYNSIFHMTDRRIILEPDKTILRWIDAEYKLFRYIEEKCYKPKYTSPFSNCQELVDFSNEILNRRKSRAGKSLEHHLSSIFSLSSLQFDEQKVTEGKNKPDFIFPGIEYYRNKNFPEEELIFLGAKTTCKDRWRQVLEEADRIKTKFLFTLQPGITTSQLDAMKKADLVLVVPEQNKRCFDPAHRDEIFSLKQFIDMVKVKQSRL